MSRTEISRELCEIKLELISSKIRFQKVIDNCKSDQYTPDEIENSKALMLTFSSMINQISLFERKISNSQGFLGKFFLKIQDNY